MNEAANRQPVQYWFARSGDHFLTRHRYVPVNWRGFFAMFGAIMGSIWLLVGGIVLGIVGAANATSMFVKAAAVVVGVLLVSAAIRFALFCYRTLKARTDPVNNASHHRGSFFR